MRFDRESAVDPSSSAHSHQRPLRCPPADPWPPPPSAGARLPSTFITCDSTSDDGITFSPERVGDVGETRAAVPLVPHSCPAAKTKRSGSARAKASTYHNPSEKKHHPVLFQERLWFLLFLDGPTIHSNPLP